MHDIETITPNLALAYLEEAAVNRNVSQPAVKRYASAMKRGQWTLAQPIIFDPFGRLIDGQHRLFAVVAAGIPVDFNVLRGVESIRHLDAGRARKPADVLAMMGHKNTNVLAAVTRLVIHMESEDSVAPFMTGNASAAITIDDVIERADNDLDLQEIASEVSSKYKPVSRMLKSAALAGWFIYTVRKNMEDDDLLDSFLEEIMGNKPVGDHNPAAVLYRTLNNSRVDQRRLGKYERAAMLIKAWNAYVEQRPMVRLFFRAYGSRAEQFPTIITDNGGN
jgi:hypothetical protein